MKRAVVALLALPLVLMLGSCFQHTFNVGTGAPQGDVVYKHWHHHWLFGLIQPKLQKVLHVDQYCPSGNATIHEEVSFVNGVIDVLIGIIYSPTTVTIRCENGTEAEIELTEEQSAALATDPAFLRIVEELAPERLEETRLALARLPREPTDGDTVAAAP